MTNEMKEREKYCDSIRSNAIEYIPFGPYCYDLSDEGYFKCPFHDRYPEDIEQGNGYCHLLRTGDYFDDENSTILLWNMVKECGINTEYEC